MLPAPKPAPAALVPRQDSQTAPHALSTSPLTGHALRTIALLPQPRDARHISLHTYQALLTNPWRSCTNHSLASTYKAPSTALTLDPRVSTGSSPLSWGRRGGGRHAKEKVHGRNVCHQLSTPILYANAPTLPVQPRFAMASPCHHAMLSPSTSPMNRHRCSHPPPCCPHASISHP